MHTARFEQLFVPEQWPAGVFELILLSEVVYCMERRDVARLASKAIQVLGPSGDIVLVHSTGVTNYSLSGDDATELFIKFIESTVEIVRQDRYKCFRLDVLSRQQSRARARRAPSI